MIGLLGPNKSCCLCPVVLSYYICMIIFTDAPSEQEIELGDIPLQDEATPYKVEHHFCQMKITFKAV